MLRVHFTPEDIARLRVAAAPDPLWEIANSFQILITEENPLVFGEWRRLVRPQMAAADRMLALLLPPRGYSPDFLTPDLDGRPDLESGVDTMLGTPQAILRRDLARLAVSRDWSRRPPPEIRALSVGDLGALRRLRSALLAHHRHALAPYWPQISAQVDADRAVRARAVLAGGADGLLAGFRPLLRWQPPVLEADYPVERELRLNGRGLLLQPSFFCSHRPVTLAAPDMPPILVYPIQHTLGWTRDRSHGLRERGADLGTLIGHTRAAILENVVTGRTTGELAQRFGITGAAASYHAAVLRRVGLLLSERRGKYTLHTITPVGLALLDSPPGTPNALDAPSAAPPHTRRRALMAQIHAFIRDNLGDAQLTPDAIAAAHHISLRYLHKLFQQDGHTVAGWVRERRLEQCRRDLANPRLAARPIHAIATRWGFTSPAHFSQAFRSAHGLSPRQFREQCATVHADY